MAENSIGHGVIFSVRLALLGGLLKKSVGSESALIIVRASPVKNALQPAPPMLLELF